MLIFLSKKQLQNHKDKKQEGKTMTLKELEKAAEQGDAQAQYELGRCYNAGDKVPKDNAIAAQWYAKAAEQGHTDAQFNLGCC